MFPLQRDKESLREKDLKKSVSFISSIIFAVALIIATPLRVLQYKNNIEAGTGFYTSTGVAVYLFYGIMVAAFVAFIALSLMNRKKLALDFTAKKNPIIAAACFISSIFCFYNGISSLMAPVDSSTPVYTVTTTSTALVGTLEKGAAICGILSGLYFVCLAVSFFVGKSCGENYKILSLFPAIWSSIRLITRFTRTVSYIRVSDLLLEMLMLAALALFFMAFAQNNSKVNGEGTEGKLLVCGFTGALLGFVVAIPRIILVLTGNESLMYELSSLELGDIGLALFAVTMVSSRLKGKKAE